MILTGVVRRTLSCQYCTPFDPSPSLRWVSIASRSRIIDRSSLLDVVFGGLREFLNEVAGLRHVAPGYGRVASLAGDAKSAGSTWASEVQLLRPDDLDGGDQILVELNVCDGATFVYASVGLAWSVGSDAN